MREVIYFKRPVYTQALTELASLAFPKNGPPQLPAVVGCEITADPAGQAAASVE